MSQEDDTDRLLGRLDKIIELLELRNSIERARQEMRLGVPSYTHEEVFGEPHPPQDSTDDSWKYRMKEGTGD